VNFSKQLSMFCRDLYYFKVDSGANIRSATEAGMCCGDAEMIL